MSRRATGHIGATPSLQMWTLHGRQLVGKWASGIKQPSCNDHVRWRCRAREDPMVQQGNIAVIALQLESANLTYNLRHTWAAQDAVLRHCRSGAPMLDRCSLAHQRPTGISAGVMALDGTIINLHRTRTPIAQSRDPILQRHLEDMPRRAVRTVRCCVPTGWQNTHRRGFYEAPTSFA
jgi:hypothetical protein